MYTYNVVVYVLCDSVQTLHLYTNAVVVVLTKVCKWKYMYMPTCHNVHVTCPHVTMYMYAVYPIYKPRNRGHAL